MNSHFDASASAIQQELLAWYDRHARILPWRTGPADRMAGQSPEPYHVWLSEVMLQQTRVATAEAYFHSFLRKWPRLEDLASASEAEILSAWAGLGYYTRARNLLRCAREVVSHHGGRFPGSAAELQQLPGIGPYTAAAIAAIAFGAPETVIDGNVERVVSRLAAIEAPIRQAKPQLRLLAAQLTPVDRPGDFAQAMMDLGAMVCIPGRPACIKCPIARHCTAYALGKAEQIPVRATKQARAKRHGNAYVAMRSDGAVFLRCRPPRGLLAGMTEVPTSGWDRSDDDNAAKPPFPAEWEKIGDVLHGFTHFDLTMTVWRAENCQHRDPQGWWSSQEMLGSEALPTIMKKVIAAAIPQVRFAIRGDRP